MSKNFSQSKISINDIFPDSNLSNNRNKKLDIQTLFINSPLNQEPDISLKSEYIINKIKKRRDIKLKHYRHILRYCYKKITDADENEETDLIFTINDSIIDNIKDCKEFDPRTCLEYISHKLRADYFDTVILKDTVLFITWKYMELKKKKY
jgi:hypothetical protein